MKEAAHWEIGNVKVTCVEETTAAFPAGMMFDSLTEDRVKAMKWLRPHYTNTPSEIAFILAMWP